MRIWRVLIAAATLIVTGPVLAKPAALSVEAVSNRADLVSGGDVLLRVSLPAGDDPEKAALAVNGGMIAGALHNAPDGKSWLALVSGLRDGRNAVTLTSRGEVAKLEVTNHPNGGPVFSGPQIRPWSCRAGAVNALCDRPTSISWSYMPKGASAFKPYDPAAPASDVATVVTSEGVTVPYIVRVESFSQNRSGVSVASLFDPKASWTPWAPQKQWNRGVFVLQGAGCGTGFSDQAAGSPLDDRALRRGFIVVTAALLHNTINCNHVVQAETAMMAKEHVAETYGPIDFTFAMGSSGGAISQIADQNAYPGLYDGLILNHLFVDSDASRMAAYDCKVVYDYWAQPGSLPYTDAQKQAVVGMISGCNSHTSTTRYEVYNPAVGTNCTAPVEVRFDPVRNPKGVRCTLQDYQVNQVGRRADGFAHGRIDNEGVQYGLKALRSGTITPAQFVEMNTAIKGHDINFAPIATRTRADRAGLKALYATGINNTTSNLAETPIIETRVLATDFHQVFHAAMTRARLVRAQGHHDNYVVWRSMTASDPSFPQAFDVMVQWIKAIRADARAIPRARKVAENRPPMARDRCTLGDGKDQPFSACPRPPELTRVLAGAPDTNDIGKCQLKPLSGADYGKISFTSEQWAALQKAFPTGVCDYAKPLLDFTKTVPWLAYAGEGKFAPLGPAPRSIDGKAR
jgi:hypothetical protein